MVVVVWRMLYMSLLGLVLMGCTMNYAPYRVVKYYYTIMMALDVVRHICENM